MGKIRVVIADDNKDIVEGMLTYFHSHPQIEIVATASNGHTCIKMIEQYKPDVVLLDNVMPQLDGLAVLELIATYKAQQHQDVKFIMCTAFAREEIMQQAVRYGATYFISKPFAFDQVERKILQCADNPPSVSMTQQVSRLLSACGIASHLKGYLYLQEAIVLVYQNRHTLNAIMDEVYLPIANKHGVTKQSVERAIRSAIQKIWAQEPLPQEMQTLFSATAPKPSNSTFIATIVDKCEL